MADSTHPTELAGPSTAVAGDSDGESGELQLGVAGHGDLRWAVAEITGPLETIRRRLDMSPLATVALGRALSAAALLLRFSTKEPGRLIFEVLGDGPLGKVVAEVDSRGRLRGLVGEPRLEIREGRGLEIGWAVGEGTLRVSRESIASEPQRGRYSSQVQLVSGELGKDLAHFLQQSQQIRSAALLGVLPRSTGIAAAGGLLIEAFPGVAEETLTRLEANIAALGGVSGYLETGGLSALRDAVLAGFDVEELERHPLIYSCRCKPDSLLASMQQLAVEDVDALVDAAGRIVAMCSFCGTQYAFDREELRVH